MSESRYPSTMRFCATCDYWTGSRGANLGRSNAEVPDSSASGKCSGGGMNQLQMLPIGTCGQWTRWGALK